jgi:hypothetical protein
LTTKQVLTDREVTSRETPFSSIDIYQARCITALLSPLAAAGN